MPINKDDNSVQKNVSADDLAELTADENTVVWVDLDIRNTKSLGEAENIYTDVLKFHYLILTKKLVWEIIRLTA